ncbi:hypothetical protein CC86DRAFT_31465 [Ophiobolus disseminans]|uniref:Uncharacterized protein n=1 Tax=Ophiobolus disseminans TaxID=1469910 RepID=A0A6A6ZZM7_9PLEO|nr:hypothetical protein CC86DRAFT_31465 [Ophiobolus disseminans]
MSGPDRPEPAVQATPSLKRKALSKYDQEDLAELDGVFKRIKRAAPRAPYILSAPSLDPYRYHSQQEANAWMLGRLFRPDEEHLQYRTFVYREPCQDCLELQAGEDDDPEPERPDSRASNTAHVAKKKLNLSAFKVRQANGTITPGSKKVSPSLPPTQVAHDQANGLRKAERRDAPDGKAGPTSPKRHNAPDGAKAAKASHDTFDTESKRRPRSPVRKTEPTDFKNNIDKSSSSDRTPHGLPPLLSPVQEPPSNPYGLPNILSPTLPSNIQAELDKLAIQRKRAESNTSTSSSDRKSQMLAAPEMQVQKPIDVVKSEPRIRSVSVNGKVPNIEPVKRKDDLEPTLVVKLKYSKAKATTVKNLLRLPAKRSSAEKKERHDVKDMLVSSQTKGLDDEPKKKKKGIPKIPARRSDNTTPMPTSSTKPIAAPASTTKVQEKRPRTDDDVASAVPSKRPRAASSQDRPHTPTSQVISSPSLSNKSSAQKVQPQHATPKNSHKAVNMLRTASTESNDSTPGRSVATPAGVKHEAKGGPTSAPMNGKKQADITLLAQTSMKLNQMGRALKHEATKILTGPAKQVTKQDEKRAAVTNMECILSYMAAYYAQDASLNLRGRPGEVEQTWKTLLPLCLSYARSTKDFKHLDGLRSYLSSVIASAICTHVSQRVATSRPHDSPQDVSHADLAKQHSALVSNFALLSDHTMKMNQHYQEARIALPFEEIQSIYKNTFASREANAKLAKDPEKINGARMAGPYFLPLSNDTTPVQAVRFGLKFLNEYCEKEKLDYSLRVNLDKPE